VTVCLCVTGAALHRVYKHVQAGIGVPYLSSVRERSEEHWQWLHGAWIPRVLLSLPTHPGNGSLKLPHVHPRQQRTFLVVLQKSPHGRPMDHRLTCRLMTDHRPVCVCSPHGSGVRGLKADKLKTKNHEPVRGSVRPSHHTTGTPATDVTGSSGVSWSIYLRCRGAARRRHRAVHGPRRQHGRCHGRWLGCWLGSTKEPRPHA